MAADVAMTKKGFGEMAITGTMAGPVFNVYVGFGFSMFLKFVKMKDPFNETVPFSLYLIDSKGAKNFNVVSVLPLTLIIG